MDLGDQVLAIRLAHRLRDSFIESYKLPKGGIPLRLSGTIPQLAGQLYKELLRRLYGPG
jgi:hypothetical protein